MLRNMKVNLGDLVLSLSYAMDLASPSLIRHQQRVAYIVWEMIKQANLARNRQERCLIAAMLHDIGAFSLEEKVALHNFEVQDPKDHCIRGEALLDQVPRLENSAKHIRFHHTEWQIWNEPIENDLVLESQIIFLADYLERLIDRKSYILHQYENITSKIKHESGNSFHPEVIDLFLECSNREEFWLDIVNPHLDSILLNEGPFRTVEIGIFDILCISELFRNIIDFKSRFTSTHSSGVSATATMIAKIFGFAEPEVQLIEVAGNLHDLGKLAVPSYILDKAGKLTQEEMAIMKAHTYHTYNVLKAIRGLEKIAEWAAFHHERLDGSGYPFHCTKDELSTGARIIMVADIFTALSEDRPYRKGMSKNEIMKILKRFSEKELFDVNIVNLLFDNYDEIYSYLIEKQAAARKFYERRFAD